VVGECDPPRAGQALPDGPALEGADEGHRDHRRVRRQREAEGTRLEGLQPAVRGSATYPGAHLDAIEMNRQRLTLPPQEIVHLNLPAGEHEIHVLVGLGASPGELTIQGTLLEPRRTCP
jgi:hypothetical protein